MVMIGLTLIGAAGATWAGQENAQTVWLDQSLWDSLKSGQCKRLDNDVVVARTARGMFVWCPAAPTEAHGTGANQADAALDKIQEALDSILGRGVPEAPTMDLESLLASDSEDADSPSPHAASRLTPEEVAGDLDLLASLATEYDPACGGLARRTLKVVLTELCTQIESGSCQPEELWPRLEPLHGKAPELYQALSKMIPDMEDSTYGVQH